MKNHHIRKPSRCCAHCGERLTINPRLGKRHRFCSKPECAKASRASARKKWLRKNGGKAYYAGRHNADRVRAWRNRHPQYWKKRRRRNRLRIDFVLTRSLAAALRYVALQDTIDTRLALQIGIISRLSGAALQDTIAKEIEKLTMRGHAILRGKPSRASK